MMRSAAAVKLMIAELELMSAMGKGGELKNHV